MKEWINANLEPAEGQTLDLHQVADRFLRRSTFADRRAVPDPEAELKRLLPIERGKIVGYTFSADMSTRSDRLSEGSTWRRPRHVSEWNKL